MKKRDLEKFLVALGWWYLRQGGAHEVWTNGVDHLAIPRHREIKEMTARAILRVAEGNPPLKHKKVRTNES